MHVLGDRPNQGQARHALTSWRLHIGYVTWEGFSCFGLKTVGVRKGFPVLASKQGVESQRTHGTITKLASSRREVVKALGSFNEQEKI
jgi:hypothetical protein